MRISFRRLSIHSIRLAADVAVNATTLLNDYISFAILKYGYKHVFVAIKHSNRSTFFQKVR